MEKRHQAGLELHRRVNPQMSPTRKIDSTNGLMARLRMQKPAQAVDVEAPGRDRDVDNDDGGMQGCDSSWGRPIWPGPNGHPSGLAWPKLAWHGLA